ncbi:nucleotidyl transferase AbiEii/AbiGii toxin family protein [Glycomyces sp. L485]|uniref:nucleotidyl transferase AbiEii/AbiGii toxin family protein n=1 Tax=Glycomyces sp. L485 TaxID=2909235 RepID=UPI001F4A839F|nr:nucleotidyl transferase AbiEii/AbiGii toxin family protein [Glycomyces sp. L485]
MTERPTRATTAGRAYLDLQNLARRDRRPTDELLQIYALEGFLARLAVSEHADRLVLKGGVLLAAFDTRRPTRDIDFQGQRIPGDETYLRDVVLGIADIELDDGLDFDYDDVAVETIRDEETYSGVRIIFSARLSVARLRLHVDINVGDPVWPGPRPVPLPRLLGGHIDLVGYPLTMVFAEKLVTAIQRGTANTRWRDFADIYLLFRRHDVNGVELAEAVGRVAAHRQALLAPLSEALDGFAGIAQARWRAWRRKQRLDGRLPEQFSELLDAVTGFADPVVSGTVNGWTWSAAEQQWQSH